MFRVLYLSPNAPILLAMSRAAPQHGLTIVAMSGGVDSSVSAVLLREQGRVLAGMFMKNWEEDDRDGACPAERDAADAQAVADRIGIALHRRNFSAEYWDCVFEDFLAGYRSGRTPNPDILCNREIKFRAFLDHARDLGADRIATGHYARVGHGDDGWQLLRGRDPGKDQSYFLYSLGQEQLACTDFPVGDLPKSAVRERASAAGLPVHDKKDSTGICFIGERDFSGFLARFIESAPGEIRTPDGKVLGQHRGLMFHTLGQRQGLGIGGVRGHRDAPWYVLHKDIENNVLYVGQEHDHPWLLSRHLEASQLSWVAGQPPAAGARLQAQVRYRQAAQDCTVIEAGPNRLVLVFDHLQRAVTPGQSVVLYRGEVCLGGGIIDASDAPPAPPPLRGQSAPA